MKNYSGDVVRIHTNLETLKGIFDDGGPPALIAFQTANPDEFEVLTTGRAQVRMRRPTLGGSRTTQIAGTEFALRMPDPSASAPYRVLVREVVPTDNPMVPTVVRPVFRSRDVPITHTRLHPYYRVLDAADRAWLATQGIAVPASLSFDTINAALAPAVGGAVKRLSAKEENDQVRISFEIEIPGPNVKGKIMLEPSASDSYDFTRLAELAVKDVDLFGLASIGEFVLDDLVEVAVELLNATPLGTIALPDFMAELGGTVTLTHVFEEADGLHFDVAVGWMLSV